MWDYMRAGNFVDWLAPMLKGFPFYLVDTTHLIQGDTDQVYSHISLIP